MKYAIWVGLAMFVASNSACNGTGSSNGDPQTSSPPDVSKQDPVNPPASGGDSESPSPSGRTFSKDVLLFNGTGVSTSDWQSTESILKDQKMSYQLVNSAQLNAMTLDQIADFGTIVVPGGTGSTITNSLTSTTRLKVRQAVRDRGVGYVGFCAGAWVAVGPEAEGNSTASYGMAVANGSVLDEFFPNGQEPTAAMVKTTFADGSSRQLVWWGGPITPEWTSGVVARYDTGVPAISETRSGQGYVVVSGPHPEAPDGWRATAGYDSDGLDFDIAVAMIRAAITQVPMAAF